MQTATQNGKASSPAARYASGTPSLAGYALPTSPDEEM